MTKGTLTTKGFDEYLERVVAAGKDVDAAADRALILGAEMAKAGMQSRVAKKTRNLHDHIVVGVPRVDGNYHSINIGLLHADDNTAIYGNVQEYGSAKMPAHPYIRPTMAEDKAAIRAAMLKSLKADGTI